MVVCGTPKGCRDRVGTPFVLLLALCTFPKPHPLPGTHTQPLPAPNQSADSPPSTLAEIKALHHGLLSICHSCQRCTYEGENPLLR